MAGLSNFEFFKILLPGLYEEALRLPTKFGELLGDRRDLKLRLTGGEILWDVEVVVEKRGDMYLRKGWKKFARAHNLRDGYMLVFRYDDVRGDLVVTVFDLTTCRKEYLHAGAVGDAHDVSSIATATQARGKEAERTSGPPRRSGRVRRPSTRTQGPEWK